MAVFEIFLALLLVDAGVGIPLGRQIASTTIVVLSDFHAEVEVDE